MVRNKIIYVYLILLLTVFPLCFWDYYYDIADTKFIVFTGTTAGTLAAVLICRGKYVINNSVKWMILWCMVNIISFFLSPYKRTALTGTSGRDYGLVTIFCITVMFVLIVSAKPPKEKFINIFIVSSVVVAVLAVINSYGKDFIGFYDGVRTDLRMYYQTTLGHVDICSSFFAISLPVAVVMAVKEKGWPRKIFYMVSSVIIFAGLFGGGCDSGYIHIMVLVTACIFYFKDYRSVAALSVLEIMMLWTAKIMMLLNHRVESAREMDSIAVLFTDGRVVAAGSIFLGVVTGVCIYRIRSGKEECPVLRRGLLLGIFIFFVLFTAAFLYFTFMDRNADIGSLSNLLRFCDEWGSCRGYVWRVTVERYVKLPWYHIVFGTGPDTIERVLTPIYGDEMVKRFGAVYDNAHNEYLQYLFTTGIAGLVTYIGLLCSSVRSGISHIRQDENVAPFLIAAICYLVQAVVNINQVITTPLMFLSLAMIAFCEEE